MNRKEAIAAWKMRKTPRGVYKLRFSETGPVFADAVPDLDAARNGLLAAKFAAGGFTANPSAMEAVQGWLNVCSACGGQLAA